MVTVTTGIRIRCGFKMHFSCAEATPMLVMLSVHPSRQRDILTPSPLEFEPPRISDHYLDSFGNICHRIHAARGALTISSQFTIYDRGLPDPVCPAATQATVETLPTDTIIFLLSSRYCETDRLSEIAWSLFGEIAPGWSRVKAICDFVHLRIIFGYQHSRLDKSAYDVLHEGRGVCRDFAHLAITLCRCMNIPARYCTGYLGDIGVPANADPMDFSAWFEAYLIGPDGGQWYPFDARHNVPRIGRVLMARGRDATDVALSISFGTCDLRSFEVVSEQIPDASGYSNRLN